MPSMALECYAIKTFSFSHIEGKIQLFQNGERISSLVNNEENKSYQGRVQWMENNTGTESTCRKKRKTNPCTTRCCLLPVKYLNPTGGWGGRVETGTVQPLVWSFSIQLHHSITGALQRQIYLDGEEMPAQPGFITELMDGKAAKKDNTVPMAHQEENPNPLALNIGPCLLTPGFMQRIEQ